MLMQPPCTYQCPPTASQGGLVPRVPQHSGFPVVLVSMVGPNSTAWERTCKSYPCTLLKCCGGPKNGLNPSAYCIERPCAHQGTASCTWLMITAALRSRSLRTTGRSRRTYPARRTRTLLDRVVPHLRGLELHDLGALTAVPDRLGILPELVRGPALRLPGPCTIHPARTPHLSCAPRCWTLRS